MLIYPAIFTEDDAGGYTVAFPDVDGCITEGENMEHAVKMAVEALDGVIASMVDRNIPIPAASDIKAVKAGSEKEHIAVICSNADRRIAKTKTRAIKKTLTIPEWLGEIADQKHINYSSVLQSALKEQLGVQ
ncbi:MAG: type II toxin-antitoxin system HicB family antitoxin [Clostridiales bacterium]|jgi:predicted RNase H-like HicB family nuclease|nr:type II toxin-antitoxin system HicB family antitoxin [Clostridiales bacterium]